MGSRPGVAARFYCHRCGLPGYGRWSGEINANHPGEGLSEGCRKQQGSSWSWSGCSPLFQSGDRGFNSRRGHWCLGSIARWWKWQTREPQKLVPTGREGSSPSLATAHPGGERDITRRCEGRVPGSIPGWGAGRFRAVRERQHLPASEAGTRRFESDLPDCNGRAADWRRRPFARRPGASPCRFDSCPFRFSKCPWPSGPGICLPGRTGGFNSHRAL